MNKTYRTQAFTLIELLIVIAIIGVLAAVLIPNLISARQAANNSGTMSLARNTVTLAEAKRSADGGVPFPTVTGCAPAVVATLPDNVDTCQLHQDADATYVLARSKVGQYFHFDGATMNGPLSTAPTSW